MLMSWASSACGTPVFDFYAPQEFTAEDGRHILIGWMGMPDEPTYGNDPTVAYGWQHCMTVPRELTAGDDGVVLQQPARGSSSIITRCVWGGLVGGCWRYLL